MTSRRWIIVLVGLAMASAATMPRVAAQGSSGRLLVTQLSKSTAWSSGEGWVVASPANPQVLTATWTSFPWKSPGAIATGPAVHPIQCGTGYSTDGGQHWVEGTLPFEPESLPVNPPGACVDPTLAVDSKGTLYAMSNGGSTLPGVGSGHPGLASFCCDLSASSDGGRTWSPPKRVATFEQAPEATAETGSPDLTFDRPWLIVDPKTDALYGTTSDDSLVERVVFASHDHGATWTTPRPLDPDDQSVWADVPSAANGVLAVAYIVDPNSKGYKLAPAPAVKCSQVCAVLETSTDDGKTWARHVIPARQVTSSSGFGPEAPGLEVAADPSTPGRYAVLLPVNASSDEVWVTTDGGAATWARTLTISGSSGDSVTKPWIAYGPTGALGVVWRSVHSNRSYEVNAVVSTNGGSTFGAPVRLSPGAGPADTPPEGTPGDDCACNLHLSNEYLYTTWGDSRSGSLQIWFARLQLASAAASTAASPGAKPSPASAVRAARTGTTPATGEPAWRALAAIGALLGGLVLVSLRRRAAGDSGASR